MKRNGKMGHEVNAALRIKYLGEKKHCEKKGSIQFTQLSERLCRRQRKKKATYTAGLN